MKNLMLIGAIALATSATAAHAGWESVGGHDRWNPNKQTLFDNALDFQPTASIGASETEVFKSSEYMNGRQVTVRYRVVDGDREILSISQSSDR